MAPNLSFTRDKGERFLPGGALEVVQTNTLWAGLDVGVQFRNWGEIRIGARRGTFDGEVSTLALFPDFDIDQEGGPLSAGTHVMHPVYGAGQVTRIDGVGARMKVVVRFENGREKTLIPEYAGLQIISGGQDW